MIRLDLYSWIREAPWSNFGIGAVCLSIGRFSSLRRSWFAMYASRGFFFFCYSHSFVGVPKPNRGRENPKRSR